MRIFQVLYASANSSLPENQTWYRNLYEPLVEMGHDVFFFSAEEGQKAMLRKDPRLRARFSQRLLDSFREEHNRQPFDLFFAYLKDRMVEPGVIDEIRRYGVPTCNFSCNNMHQFDVVKEISLHFDFNLHAEREARDLFLDIGAIPLWWPMGSNPRYFKPQDLPRDLDVTFVGANYALRLRYVSYLLEKGVDIHVYGPRWKTESRTPVRAALKRYLLLWRSLCATSIPEQARASAELESFDFRRYLRKRFPSSLHPPVLDQELIALYSRSNISLGFLEVYDQHDPTAMPKRHLHLREFEAPMSGALYCTGYIDELSFFFVPDVEILVYRNRYELFDKVQYYLTHPDEAERIRKAGFRRALSEHTYHQRFATLFKKIGLNESSL